jgi:hypothetical protein
MKHLFKKIPIVFALCLVSFLYFTACKAQNILVAIKDYRGMFDEANAYYFDSESDFNKFVGTWKWESSASSITITLEKRQHVFIPFRGCFYDLLIGEYEYVNDSGVNIVNTLPNLSNNTIQPYDRNIWGYNMLPAAHGNPYTPNNASTNVEYRRVDLRFKDPERTYFPTYLYMRYIDDAIPKIEIQLSGVGIIILDPGQDPVRRVPTGFFTLVKQP